VPGLGIYGPTLGVLADALLQAGIMLAALRQDRFRPPLAWAPHDPRLREVIRLLVPNGLSLVVNYAGTIVDTAFASLAREPGALPSVHNAFLLVGLPIRLLGLAIGQSVFPRIAAHAAAQAWQPFRRVLLRALLVACGLALPTLVALIVLGRPLIHALFERGRFTAAAGDLTYTALVAYLVALPAYIGTEILSRALIALYDTRTPLLTNLLQTGARAALIWALIGQIGVLAIPVAFAITSALETLALAAALMVKLRGRG
jgi:putative peptidoglycan lipid II flippase